MSNKRKVYWPKWLWNAEGESRIFHRSEDVPVGWYSKEQAEAIASEEGESPEADPDVWAGGYHKDELIALLRKAGEKIHANAKPRTLFKKAQEAGLLIPKEPEDDNPKPD